MCTCGIQLLSWEVSQLMHGERFAAELESIALELGINTVSA